MRMRKKRNFEQRMQKCQELLLYPADGKKLDLCALAAGRNVHLEIGCGKGRFITQMAKNNPDRFFIALEREPNVLLMAMELALLEGAVDNLRFISGDAGNLRAIFDDKSITRIYINFCDPWPPKKQAKRRLTHCNFLDIYNNVLRDDGEIYFKTDNERLFEFSLNQFAQHNHFNMRNITLDLHHSDYNNIMTEYEEKFSSQGFKIYRLEAYKI